MTEYPGGLPPREVVVFQLSLLELYESLLDACEWDEAKLNAVLKSFMASVLGLMRLQQSLGEHVRTTQKEWIREYRAHLEQWLAEQGDGMSRGGDR
jgi:hypothetical protein